MVSLVRGIIGNLRHEDKIVECDAQLYLYLARMAY